MALYLVGSLHSGWMPARERINICKMAIQALDDGRKVKGMGAVAANRAWHHLPSWHFAFFPTMRRHAPFVRYLYTKTPKTAPPLQLYENDMNNMQYIRFNCGMHRPALVESIRLRTFMNPQKRKQGENASRSISRHPPTAGYS